MKKQADPWDDSALLNAFDDAITKYKKTHKKERCDHSNKGEDVVTGTSNEAFSTAKVLDQTPKESTLVRLKDGGNANDPSVVEENHDTESRESYQQASNGVGMQEVVDGYTNSQGVDAQNELMKQYYELEEQKQKVVQQLQEAGYWNYQYSGEVEEHQVFNQQASHATTLSYCCPYACPCLITPSGASVGNKDIESTSLEDDTIVKTALGAAERAISSMSLNAYGQLEEKSGPDSDLTALLNAWYSAGFYTAKYLSEQSISKGRRR